jgi:heavy metal sensor kinase
LESTLGAAQKKRADRIALLISGKSWESTSDLKQAVVTAFAPEASARFVRISQLDGTILYASGNPVDASFDSLQISAPAGAAGVRRERQREGAELMIGTVMTKQGWRVETGESLAPALSELHRLISLLTVAFLLVTVVALSGSLVLLRRALRPVVEITRSAERITSRSLSERLPVPHSGDEFEHLSKALNGMIARLEDSFQHNRRFLADASHELRTPLTILRSELEAMVLRKDIATDLRETLGNLLEEAVRLAGLVENLFALSRLDAGEGRAELQRFDFAQLVATTAEQMCLLAEDKGLRVAREASAPLWVEGDRSRLKQVIVNLLDNAIKYTPSGGSIRLTATAQNGAAVLLVEDTGIGIPPESLPRVFDRFFRVDDARSRIVDGAGIGLSIVKAICAAHQGRVEVESTLGVGSRFTVILPILDAASQRTNDQSS